MPVVGMGRTADLLTHQAHSTPQLSEHGIASAFGSPSMLAMSATTIGQAIGAISSNSTLAHTSGALPIPPSIPAQSKQLAGSRPDVVCPLATVDGTICRKKCSGTFAYRSICEHIRRAHPDHWIPRLPASEESFQKMIQLTPTTSLYQGLSTSGGSQPSMNGVSSTSKKATAGPGPKQKAKAAKARSPAEESDVDYPFPATSGPGSEYQNSLAEPKELYAHEIPQSSVNSETDTESEHSPVSPQSLSALSTPILPPLPSRSAVTKSKPSSRKKSTSNPGSKTKSSPKKITARRRTIDKKTSSNALAALYSTVGANHELSPHAASTDMMDVDTEMTPRQNYVFGQGHGDCRPSHGRHEDRDELDTDEVGLILGNMSKASQHHNHGTPQLRRAYSFSVGDCNGSTGSISLGGKIKGGLAINTNVASEYDKGGVQSGSMSAGGVVSKFNGGSSWDDLIEAAKAATEETKAPKSPLLYQSVHPTVSGDSNVPRRNQNPYGPDLTHPLKVMMDIAVAEADNNQRHRQQPGFQPLQHAHPQNFMNSFAYPYLPPGTIYPNPYGYNPYHPYANQVFNHANSFFNGSPFASRDSSGATSHASTPAYSKPSSPRLENSPKIQCSICHTHVDISMSLACSECINGFCQPCVLSHETFEPDNDGGIGGLSKMKLGNSPELGTHGNDGTANKRPSLKSAGPMSKCGVCGVVGAKYRPVKLVVHV